MTLGYIVIITMLVWKPTIKKHAEADYANLIHSWKDKPQCCYLQPKKNNKFGEAFYYQTKHSKHLWL